MSENIDVSFIFIPSPTHKKHKDMYGGLVYLSFMNIDESDKNSLILGSLLCQDYVLDTILHSDIQRIYSDLDVHRYRNLNGRRYIPLTAIPLTAAESVIGAMSERLLIDMNELLMAKLDIGYSIKRINEPHVIKLNFSKEDIVRFVGSLCIEKKLIVLNEDEDANVLYLDYDTNPYLRCAYCYDIAATSSCCKQRNDLYNFEKTIDSLYKMQKLFIDSIV